MHKLIYEPPVLTLYAYSVEVGYAMLENGEQYHCQASCTVPDTHDRHLLDSQPLHCKPH